MIHRLVLSALALALVVGCQSKKTTEDNSANTAPTTTQSNDAIENTPMAFDAQGSDSGKIDGLKTINFEYDKSALTSEAKKTLAGNADWLKKNSNNLQIEGHCDSRGTIEYNLALGERRAQAVKSYLVGLGIAANRLSVISYGKEKPVADGDSEAAMAKNRRANFVPLAQ